MEARRELVGDACNSDDTSLVPRRSRPPGERPSGVLNELSRHRRLSPLEFQRVQSDCSFQTFRKVAMTLFDKSLILLVS